jgi:hypothetical protein
MPFDEAMVALKQFEGKADRGNLKFSTTPLEVSPPFFLTQSQTRGSKADLYLRLQGEAIYFDRTVHDELVLPLSQSRYGEVPSSASSDRASDVW